MVSQASILDGKWETVITENDALARHENGFVGVDNKFYLIGGRGLKPISIYDVDKNSWSEGAMPPIEIHHFQAVAYKGLIYVIGAMTGKYPYEKPVANILIYNPRQDIWHKGDEIPVKRRRGSAGIVVNKGKAYIISGIVDGHNGTHVPWTDSYNLETKKWQVLSDAPRSRDHFHAVISNGKIYAVGGRNSSFATNQTFQLTIPEVDIYNVEDNTWYTLPEKSNLQIERAGASTVFVKNYLVLIGGESESQKQAHKQVDALNTQTNKWLKLDMLETGRHGSQAIIYKGKIYIAAGSGNRGGKPELSSLEKFTCGN